MSYEKLSKDRERDWKEGKMNKIHITFDVDSDQEAQREKEKEEEEERPYVYHPTVIRSCFVGRLDSNRVLHDFLAMGCYFPYDGKIMKACGLTSLPDRRTFDRRLLANIFIDINFAYFTITLGRYVFSDYSLSLPPCQRHYYYSAQQYHRS
jgi:hypothetical protein